MSARRAVAVLALGVALVLPELAAACPMCFAGQGAASSRAFALGSLMLSVLPLAVIGGAVLFLRRRARALRHPADDRPDAPPSLSRASSPH